MPVFNLNPTEADDIPQFDASPSFDGGQVSNVRANLLQPNQVTYLENYEITPNGQLVLRRGTAPLGGQVGTGTYIQGLTYFDTPSFQYPIAFNGTAVYGFIGGVWTILGTYNAFSSLQPISLTQGIDKVYIADAFHNIFSWDGTTYDDLGSGGNATPPNAPAAILWFTSRLIASAIKAEPDAIYFSQFLDGSVWDKANWQIRVGGGEADQITGIIPWTNFNLIVLKNRSIWAVNCDPTLAVADFSINPIHRVIGCPAPRTAAQVGSDVFFLSPSGVRSVQRTIASEQQQEIGEALSYPVQDIIERINPLAITTANAIYWNNRYLLALPLDSASSPNYILVYNNLTKSWSGVWTGLTPTAFAVRGVSGESPRLMIGMANGKVVDWLDYVHLGSEMEETFQDSGSDIGSRVRFRAFTFNEPVCPKTGFNVEFEFNGSLAEVTPWVVLDDKPAVYLLPEFTPNPPNLPLVNSVIFNSGTPGITLPHMLPFTLPVPGVLRRSFDLQHFGQFREIQLEITTQNKKVALRSIAASAWTDTMVVQH